MASSRSVPELVAPRYGAGCVSDLVPVLLGMVRPGAVGLDELRPAAAGAPSVLVVLDGVGAEQVADRPEVAPTIAGMTRRSITSVAPSTTAVALTSITTGLTPGEHGIVGYRMVVDDQVLNTLRWGSKETPDARRAMPGDVLQPYPPFCGESVPHVTDARFGRSGLTRAHLRGGRPAEFRTPAVLVHEVVRLVAEGERFVYAYWDGVDKVSHEYGLGSEYDAELAFADRLVADLIERLPAGTQLVVTADHGQVDCGHGETSIDRSVLADVEGLSGEARFRWLHVAPGAADDVAAAALECHGHHSWVRTLDQVLDEGWFGPNVRNEVVDRLGDVVLVPFEPIGFHDPDDTGLFSLIGRHGSLTPAEMLVPLALTTT